MHRRCSREPQVLVLAFHAILPQHSSASFHANTHMKEKETWVAYLLWFFFGFIGVHKFYLGKMGWGILYLLTGGIFLIGWVIDLFTIPSQVRQVNADLRSLLAGAARPVA